MSSSDMRSMSNRQSRRTIIGALLSVAVAAPLVAGCESGFRPLYATGPDGDNVTQRLRHVDIAPIPSRVGQRVRNALIFENNGGGRPDSPEYRLDIVITESLASTLVRSDGEAASQIYNLDANFKLTRLSDKKVLLQGTSFGRAGFDRFTNIYSNVRAREDAENRAARTVATDLSGRVAAFLARPPA